MFGSQQLVLQRCDVCDALLLEGLQTGIKSLLHTQKDGVNTKRNTVQRNQIFFGEMQYLLGEQSLHRGQVSAVVISLQAVLFLS